MKTWAVLGGLWALTLTAGSFNWYYKYHPRTSRGWEPIRYRDVYITNYVTVPVELPKLVMNNDYVTNTFITTLFITNPTANDIFVTNTYVGWK